MHVCSATAAQFATVVSPAATTVRGWNGSGSIIPGDVALVVDKRERIASKAANRMVQSDGEYV